MKKLFTLLAAVLLLAIMACSGGGSSTQGTVSNGEPEIDATLGPEVGTPLYMGSSQLSSSSMYSSKYKSVPSDYLQGVPWVSQLPPGDIKTSANCGPTSFLMADAFYAGRVPSQSDTESTIKEFVDWLATDEETASLYITPWKPGLDHYVGAGTGPFVLKKLAESRKYKAEEIWSESSDYLVEEYHKGHPVLVRIHYQPASNIGKTEMIKNFNADGTSKGHYVLLVGIDNDWVYIHDPSRSWDQGQAKGAYQKYSRSSFETVWHDGPKGNHNVGMVFYKQNEPLPVTIAAPSIANIANAHATVGQVYSATLAPAHGEPPYNWSIFSGVLPTGLILTQNGDIVGTPTSGGVFRFEVRVKDRNQTLTDAPVSLTVDERGSIGSLEITSNSTLLTGRLFEQYQFKLTAAGDSGPFNWSVISGALPTGLSLSSDGQISGIPTLSGTYRFRSEVRNTVNLTSIKDFEINVLNSCLFR